MPTPDHTPTVRARRLGAELRRLREHAGLSPDDAARAVTWSRPKLNKFETAARRPTLSEVETLLDLYGASGPVRLALMQLARDIHKRGWWSAYDDVLTPAFAELEDQATRILTWQTQIIPGLLQTEDFMLALLGSGGGLDEYEIKQRREARLLRQARLIRHDAPRLDVVLDEAILRRKIGGDDVMGGQLAALLDAAARPNVSLRVLATDAGLYPAIGEGSFVIFELGLEDPAVLYLETIIGGLIVEDIERVTRCNVTFRGIEDAALSEEESAALITAIINE
jgi:transcriptional regulator with XRE-family HTH domain